MLPRLIKLVIPFILLMLLLLITLPRPAAATQDLLPVKPRASFRLADGQHAAQTGLQLLYGETQPEGEETTLWRASAADPSQKQVFATLAHRAGYPPEGILSPDGQRTAVLVIPPGTDETSARTQGGELWLAALDGSAYQQVPARAGSLGHWSPDGQWFTYGHLVALANPPHEEVPFQSEFYRVNAAGTTSNLFFSDQDSYGIQPLGWAADGSYLFARIDLTGRWSLIWQDPAAGQTLREELLLETELVRRLSLSPDGSRLLIEHTSAGQVQLTVMDLSGQTVSALSEAAAAPYTEGQPVSPLQALWTASSELMVFQQPGSGPPRVNAGPAGSAAPQASLSTGEFLLPESSSPDDAWLLWSRYPNRYTLTYLQPRGQDSLRQIVPEQPGDWITPFGWIPAGGTQ